MPKGIIEFKPSKPHEIPASFNGNNGITASIDTSMSGVDSAMFSQTTFLGTGGEDQKYRHLKYELEHGVGNYITIDNNDAESVVCLYSKSGARLSVATIPSKLPPTGDYRNKYLFLDAHGKLVWNTISGDYYSGVAIEIDQQHNINLLYDVNYFKVVDGQLTLNLDTIATKSELNAKQDTVQFLTLTSPSGYLSSDNLVLMATNKVNKFVYGGKIYYLSVINNNTRIYMAKAIDTADGGLNTIELDMNSGQYQISSAIDKLVSEHINNSTIHVTEQDKQNWNNKVSAAVSKIQLNGDYELKLEINNK